MLLSKLIIFDFDGTIADTRELIISTNREVLRRMRYGGEPTDAQIVATIGLPLKDAILAICPDLTDEVMPEWMRLYREVLEELRERIIPTLFPGVAETLDLLASRGLRFTIASARGTVSLHSLVRDMGMAGRIAYILGAEDAPRAKPWPDPVLKTLEAMGTSASEAMVVGDMPVDIQMGRNACVATCGVTYGNSSRDKLKAAGADYVIDSFPELLDIIR